MLTRTARAASRVSATSRIQKRNYSAPKQRVDSRSLGGSCTISSELIFCHIHLFLSGFCSLFLRPHSFWVALVRRFSRFLLFQNPESCHYPLIFLDLVIALSSDTLKYARANAMGIFAAFFCEILTVAMFVRPCSCQLRDLSL